MEYEKPTEYLMGAIIGDIVGSIYEHNNIHTERFPLFHRFSSITDDTVMTLAVAQAMINSKKNDTPLYDELVDCMQSFGRNWMEAGYGRRFTDWVWTDDPEPYNSWGNGAPMRCSPAGWVTDDPDKAYALGRATAEPTHNHPLAMKAAGVTAALICMSRNKASMEDMKTYAESLYPISSLRRLRIQYEYTESSQGTMPAALSCFFASDSFEDCIRKAISIGGDSDTIAAIAGSIAGAHYGIPEDILTKAWTYVPTKLRQVLYSFRDTFIT